MQAGANEKRHATAPTLPVFGSVLALLHLSGCSAEVENAPGSTTTTTSSVDATPGEDPLPEEAPGEHYSFILLTALDAALTQQQKGQPCEGAAVAAGSEQRPYLPDWAAAGWSCLAPGGFEPPSGPVVYDYRFDDFDSTPDKSCTAQYCFTMQARWLSPSGDDEDLVMRYAQYGTGAAFGISDIIRVR